MVFKSRLNKYPTPFFKIKNIAKSAFLCDASGMLVCLKKRMRIRILQFFELIFQCGHCIIKLFNSDIEHCQSPPFYCLRKAGFLPAFRFHTALPDQKKRPSGRRSFLNACWEHTPSGCAAGWSGMRNDRAAPDAAKQAELLIRVKRKRACAPVPAAFC